MIPSSASVATFRVIIRPDYQAEFLSRMPSIFGLSPEEKRAARINANGSGFDPLVLLDAFQRVRLSLEAARARREIEQALEEFRKIEEARRKAAEGRPDEKK